MDQHYQIGDAVLTFVDNIETERKSFFGSPEVTLFLRTGSIDAAKARHIGEKLGLSVQVSNPTRTQVGGKIRLFSTSIKCKQDARNAADDFVDFMDGKKIKDYEVAFAMEAAEEEGTETTPAKPPHKEHRDYHNTPLPVLRRH